MPEKELRDTPRSVRDQYEKAVAATQRNNLDYAIAILTAVVAQEPGLYAAREALRDAQLRKAGNRGGFLKKMFGTASASPMLAKAQIELHTNPLQALETAPGVVQVGLRGDHLHAITQAGAHDAESLRQALGPLGQDAVIEQADPTLEDVFTALTRPAVDHRGGL